LAQQPKSGLAYLTVEESRLHTMRHTCSDELLWTSNQHITETATYTT